MGKKLDVIPGDMPKQRWECVDGPRPCLFLRCQHHLAVDLTETKTPYFKVRHAGEVDLETGKLDREITDLRKFRHTCALDVASEGPKTSEQVARLLGITRQRVESIEQNALKKLAANPDVQFLREYLDQQVHPVLRPDDGPVPDGEVN